MQPVKTKKKLSRADKKQIEAAIARANRTDKKGKSAQDSIPYERMWPAGICHILYNGIQHIATSHIKHKPARHRHAPKHKQQELLICYL